MLIIKGWRKSLACETMAVLRAIAIGSVCKYEAGWLGAVAPAPMLAIIDQLQWMWSMM